jgi:hypothetical protein
MGMTFSTEARAMVDRAVDYFGGSSTIAATDGTSTATPKAMVTSFDRALVDGTQILTSDLQVIIPNSEISFIPTHVKVDDRGYRVLNPGIVEPGDDRIFYRLHVREV